MQESIISDKKLRKSLKKTVKKVVKAVKSTLGPSGTNVGVLSKIMLPVITNDGVTVMDAASKIFPENSPERYFSNLLKTVSKNTDKIANDGTTTSLVLAETIILGSIKHIEAGFSQADIKKGIYKATVMVLEEIESRKIPVDDDLLRSVASISANNDKALGEIIANAFLKVGLDGQIELKPSSGKETYIETINGMKYDVGYESNLFVNSDKDSCVLKNSFIFIYEGKLLDLEPIEEIIKTCANEQKPILIIADDYGPNVIDTLSNIKIQHKLKICAIKSPGFGFEKEKNIDDIAFITNTKVISPRLGVDISESTVEFLGVGNVTINKDSFTVSSEMKTKEEVQQRVKGLKDNLDSLDDMEKSETLDRIAKLSSGTAVMHVHGDSPIEITEKIYRIEDAIGSTRAALEQGILPGGGVTLLKISKSLKMPKMDNKDQEIGFEILLKSLEAPIRTICENSNAPQELVIQEITKKNKNFSYGYDAKQRKYTNLVEQGVIDAAKTTITAFTNASSVSQLLISMNSAIYKN